MVCTGYGQRTFVLLWVRNWELASGSLDSLFVEYHSS